MRRRRAVYVAVLLLLVVLLGGLVYALLTIGQAAEPEQTEVFPGLKHIRSIYGIGDKADDLLIAPYGVAFEAGQLYVSDSQRSVVYVFDEKGAYVRTVAGKGRAPGQLMQPLGVAEDAKGRLYVADRAHSKLVIYGPDGVLIKEIPVELPLTPYVVDGLIYLTTGNGVTLFDAETYQELASWGKRGRGENEFDFPNGIAKDTDGTVYVSDGNNLRVKAVDGDGQTKWTVGKPPASMSDTEGRVFGLPGGMVLVGDTLYITDPLNGVIHLVSKDGTYLAAVGDVGSEEGFFSYPSQIAHLGGKAVRDDRVG